jgi:PAS domain S-box-containing protein
VTEHAQELQQWALIGEAVAAVDSVAVFVWNEDRHYVAVNDAACRLVGVSREELLGMAVGARSPDGAERELALTHDAPFLHGFSTFVDTSGTEVRLEWVTMHTRIAGLPHMVSVCWPARSDS